MERRMESVDNIEKKYTEEDLLYFVAFVLSRQQGDFKKLLKVAYHEFTTFKNEHQTGQRLFRHTNETKPMP
jgi:hypothetical protein